MSQRAFDCSTSIAAIVAVTDLEHEAMSKASSSVAQSPDPTARSPAMPRPTIRPSWMMPMPNAGNPCFAR